MQDEYRRGRRQGFAVLANVLIVEDDKWCDGHIVVKRIGEEVFLRCRLLVRIAQKVFEGERAQFEEVGRHELEVVLRLRWR